MGDNRDCSQDSRYLSSVGYVDKLNLVGKAQILFFSNNEEIGNLFTVTSSEFDKIYIDHRKYNANN